MSKDRKIKERLSKRADKIITTATRSRRTKTTRLTRLETILSLWTTVTDHVIACYPSLYIDPDILTIC